jgi:hypothetical protein
VDCGVQYPDCLVELAELAWRAKQVSCPSANCSHQYLHDTAHHHLTARLQSCGTRIRRNSRERFSVATRILRMSRGRWAYDTWVMGVIMVTKNVHTREWMLSLSKMVFSCSIVTVTGGVYGRWTLLLVMRRIDE